MMQINSFKGFSFLGFFGFIVLLLYFLFMLNYRKMYRQGFIFSMIVLSIYLVFVILLTLIIGADVTLGNEKWYKPFIICIIAEILISLIKNLINNRNKGKYE